MLLIVGSGGGAPGAAGAEFLRRERHVVGIRWDGRVLRRLTHVVVVLGSLATLEVRAYAAEQNEQHKGEYHAAHENVARARPRLEVLGLEVVHHGLDARYARRLGVQCGPVRCHVRRNLVLSFC